MAIPDLSPGHYVSPTGMSARVIRVNTFRGNPDVITIEGGDGCEMDVYASYFDDWHRLDGDWAAVRAWAATAGFVWKGP